MAKVKNIHHVAIVVQDLEGALKFWRDALGLEMSHVEEVLDQKSKVAFMPIGDSELELVKPTTTDSGVAKFLADRGPGMHHLCFEVDDLEDMLSHLKGTGVRLINETPLMMEGRKVAFVHPKSTYGVLVELYQLL